MNNSDDNMITFFLEKLLRVIEKKFFYKGWLYFFRLRAKSLNSEEKLRFLLKLDNSVRDMLAVAGTEYGNGSHVKHELMKYHDFFINNIRDGEVVLDVGCGGGELTLSLHRDSSANKVIGIEISKERVNRANKKLWNCGVEILHGDATSYDFSVMAVNTLILSNVLEHIEHRVSFLSRLVKQTNADKLLIRVPLFEREWTVPMKKKLGIEWRLDTTHFTEYLVADFQAEISQAGLNIESMEIRWCEIWAVVSAKNGGNL